jgi:ribulose-5-phosphate 4-epimerase/fuculose-1-phosphate aldolase
MNAPAELSRMITSLEGRVSADEWQTRLDLAAAYRLVALFRWDDLVFTHITARIPGTEHYLINPYGLMFEEITASSLVKIDLDGRKVMDSPYEINPAGFTIHSAIHAAREDAACILHLHTLDGVALSAQAGGVLPISQQASVVLNSLAYHDYEGIALEADEKPRLVRDLGDRDFLVLRNHGLLTVGASVATAFLNMYLLQATCTIQLRAQAGGATLVPVPQGVVERNGKAMRAVTRGAGGAIAWPALLRKLDRRDPSWRE